MRYASGGRVFFERRICFGLCEVFCMWLNGLACSLRSICGIQIDRNIRQVVYLEKKGLIRAILIPSKSVVHEALNEKLCFCLILILGKALPLDWRFQGYQSQSYDHFFLSRFHQNFTVLNSFCWINLRTEIFFLLFLDWMSSNLLNPNIKFAINITYPQSQSSQRQSNSGKFLGSNSSIT